MQESDTYLAILDEGQEKATRDSILAVGEERLGAPGESIKEQPSNVTNLVRLMRIVRRAAKAASRGAADQVGGKELGRAELGRLTAPLVRRLLGASSRLTWAPVKASRSLRSCISSWNWASCRS